VEGERFDVVVGCEAGVFISANSLMIEINVAVSRCPEALIGLRRHTTRALQRIIHTDQLLVLRVQVNSDSYPQWDWDGK